MIKTMKVFPYIVHFFKSSQDKIQMENVAGVSNLILKQGGISMEVNPVKVRA